MSGERASTAEPGPAAAPARNQSRAAVPQATTDPRHTRRAAPATPAAPTASPVALHVERLVLEGLPLSGRDAPRLQAALEGELTRLLASAPLPAAWQAGGGVAAMPRLSWQMPLGADPERMGRELARALYRGWSP